MRRAPVVPLGSGELPSLPRLISVLERVLGFVVPLIEINLLRVQGGHILTPAAGAGTTLLSSTHVVDWNDTGADEFRLVGYAEDTSSVSAVARYVVNGEILASVILPQGAAAVFTGAWTRITAAQKTAIANDQTGQLVLIGNGAGSVTLHAVVLQARTVSRVV